ncbi:MAG: glycosyltransferase [Candidatus Rickettsia vulgarisii]
MNILNSLNQKLSYFIILLLIIIISFLTYNYKIVNNKLSYLGDLNNHLYVNLYNNTRNESDDFNSYLKDLDNTNDTAVLEKICHRQIENSVERLDVAKAYNCLSRLENLNTKPAIYKAIKNASYSLDTLYTTDSALNLYNLIVSEYESQILKTLEISNKNDIITKYFTGYIQDEVPFLEKLISINIPDLSARALYRLSLINTLGKASYNEKKYTPNLKLAYQQLNEVLELTNIKQENTFDIAIVINDKFVQHAATTIASALLNSDLDSFYRFHIVMNPDDPVTEKSQQKLASMKYIRDYSIEFTNFDNNILPIKLMKKKLNFSRFPLLVMYRLYLDKVYPNLDNILYVDSDMLILRDLNYFKNIDMKNYLVAFTINSNLNTKANLEKDKKCHKLLPNFYPNGGLIFINLKNMKLFNASSILSDTISSSDCDFKLPNQDLMGIAFYNRSFHLSTRWNTQINSEFAQTQFSNFIIHFACSNKPWNKKYKELWKNNSPKLPAAFKDYWLYRSITPGVYSK